eukprot:8001921-Karenia_brevis.AAC.1
MPADEGATGRGKGKGDRVITRMGSSLVLHTTDASDSSKSSTPAPHLPGRTNLAPAPPTPPGSHGNPGGASASVRERAAPTGASRVDQESRTIIMDDEVTEVGDSPSDAMMTPTEEVFARQQAEPSLHEADYMENGVRSPP